VTRTGIEVRVGQVEGLTVKPTSHRARTVTRTGIEVRVGEIESLAAKPASHRAMVLLLPECAARGVEPPGSVRTAGLQPARPANAQPTQVVVRQ